LKTPKTIDKVKFSSF